MPLPYENATSGAAAMEETQRILRGFGVKKIGVMEDDEKAELVLQFELHGRMVHVAANAKSYASAWLRQNPWNTRKQASQQQWEAKALQQARISVYSILRGSRLSRWGCFRSMGHSLDRLCCRQVEPCWIQ